MTEESAPLSNISTTYKWTYAVHHIVDHALLISVNGLREALARNGIFEESRGNKAPLFSNLQTQAEVIGMQSNAVRAMLDSVNFGRVAHPDNHTFFSAFMSEQYTDILDNPIATEAQKDDAIKEQA